MTIHMSIPDELVRQAEELGLTAPDCFEQILREEIGKRHRRWSEIMRELDERPESDGMSMNEIADEVRAYRAEQRAQAAL